jgi:hypothetical protein
MLSSLECNISMYDSTLHTPVRLTAFMLYEQLFNEFYVFYINYIVRFITRYLYGVVVFC